MAGALTLLSTGDAKEDKPSEIESISMTRKLIVGAIFRAELGNAET
jgi:hypothetical protein